MIEVRSKVIPICFFINVYIVLRGLREVWRKSGGLIWFGEGIVEDFYGNVKNGGGERGGV